MAGSEKLCDCARAGFDAEETHALFGRCPVVIFKPVADIKAMFDAPRPELVFRDPFAEPSAEDE